MSDSENTQEEVASAGASATPTETTTTITAPSTPPATDNAEVETKSEVRTEEITLTVGADTDDKEKDASADSANEDEKEETTGDDKVEVKEQQSSPAEYDGIACKLAEADDYITTTRDGAVKIRFSGEKGSLSAAPAVSVIEFFQRSVKKYGSRVALKVERDNKWLSWTYSEYLENVKMAAKGFIKLGLEPYNGVGILGFNSPEWLFADLGAIFAGGLATGIYTTNNPEACQYVCSDASCNIVVVENDAQLQKILQVWEALPALKAIIQYTGEVKEKQDNVYSWNEFMDIAKSGSDEELQKRMENQAPNRCCALIYTSGTTGNPKGVMMSHDNVISACEGVAQRLKPQVDMNSEYQETCISYLPLSHIAAQMTDVWVPILGGAVVWFARPDALKGSLAKTLQTARPTLFVGVPRVFEKIEEKLRGIGANTKGIKKKLADWAKGISLKGNQNREVGRSVPYGWTIASSLLKKVSKGLGLDRCKMIFTAAAPISKQTLEYFQSINLPLFEIYGMSETGGALTMGTPGHSRITSIGAIMPINEYKIGNPDEDGSGELCFRGRNIFMGYLNNSEKTKEAIDDEGWIHSGDVGKIDQENFFYITGRIKELIITAGGENIAPVPIEDNIKAEIPLIGTAMVIGDKKKFLSCLLTCQVEIDQDTGLPRDVLTKSAQAYLKDLGIQATKAEEICNENMPEALSHAIQTGITNANKKAVSNAARVQKWKLLPLEFTTAGGELGPTQKLRRPHVMKMYKETVDEFYTV